MVHDQVKAHVVQMHLLDLVVELSPLQHLEGVPVDVQDLVRLDFGVATLHNGLIVTIGQAFAHFLLIEPFYLPLPLFLDDLDHVALVLGLENGQLDLDWAFFDHWCILLLWL